MDMATFYSIEANLTKINAQKLSQDPYCAAICGQNNWCRVLVERQLDAKTFKCWDVDYGFANVFNINQLQPLWPQFRRLHKMAIKASLAGENSPSQVRGHSLITSRKFVNFLTPLLYSFMLKWNVTPLLGDFGERA